MFEKEYSWHEFVDKCDNNQNITLLWNQSQEKRNYLQEFYDAIHKKCKSTDVAFTYNPDNDKLVIEEKAYSIPTGIRKLLENTQNTPIVINITTMNLKLLGALLKYIKHASYANIYCLYTEPKRYARKQESSGIFDLYRRMKSYEPIQGYVSMNISRRPEKWVPFLGFEGDRAIQIRELYDFTDCVPVITLPSYRPIWQNFIIRENLPLLGGLGCDSIHYVEADSILAAYEELTRLSDVYKTSLLRVSPFGTKVNALGILLYALIHEGEIDIVYDNPIEDGAAISVDIGNTHVYDITEYINIAKKTMIQSQKR